MRERELRQSARSGKSSIVEIEIEMLEHIRVAYEAHAQE